jgi:hypothetical protein
VEVFGKVQQMMTSDNFPISFFHLLTFHNHVTTFVTSGEDLWMAMSTIGDILLTIVTTLVKTY